MQFPQKTFELGKTNLKLTCAESAESESVEDRKHALEHAHSAVHYCLSNVRTQFGPDFEFESALPSFAPIFRVEGILYTGCAPPHSML